MTHDHDTRTSTGSTVLEYMYLVPGTREPLQQIPRSQTAFVLRCISLEVLVTFTAKR